MQVILVVGAMVAVALTAVVFDGTIIFKVVEHILNVFVTTTVKVPPSETVVEGVVVDPVMPEPDHNIEIGVEVDDILIGTNVFVHVIELVTGEAVTDGKPALAKT